MTKLRTHFRMAGSGLLVLVIALLTLSTALFAQELIWAKQAKGGAIRFGDIGLGIAVDGSGNSYVTGYFQGAATFGPGEANQTILNSAIDIEFNGGPHSSPSVDIYVAKYNTDGTLAWAKRAGGRLYDVGQGIAVDDSGNSYVTGLFNGAATFGAGEANQTILTSAGGNDIFVAKYNSDGTLAWAKKAGGGSDEHSSGIAVDGSSNSYVAGYIQGTATFGLAEANETTLISTAGSWDIFVAKYNSDGTLAWAKQAGGTTLDAATGIAVDRSGNSYVTGHFDDTATFGAGETNETNLIQAGRTASFVAKYNSDGTLAWAKRAGGENAIGIAVDVSANSYVTGGFSGTATFGLGELNQTILTSSGDTEDIFVAKYNSDGTLAWVKSAGSTSFDSGQGIALDGVGNSYVTGLFEATATFGAGEVNQTVLTSAGEFDIFVAKFSGGLHSILNNFVSFVPISSSFNTTANVSGCPAGFVGKFSFNARLTDKSSSPSLSDLTAKVKTLTNGNLLQNADGGPGGVGASLTITEIGSYTDGVLSPNESVDVPFVICLKNRSGFSFFVDVVGIGH